MCQAGASRLASFDEQGRPVSLDGSSGLRSEDGGRRLYSVDSSGRLSPLYINVRSNKDMMADAFQKRSTQYKNLRLYDANRPRPQPTPKSAAPTSSAPPGYQLATSATLAEWQRSKHGLRI